MIGKKPVRVRLVLVDAGSFHEIDVELPAKSIERHDRLVDALQEDPDVLARIHVDVARLGAAYRVDE